MVRKLTCDLGVGVGEVATDNDLVRLRPIKVTVGFGELTEKVTDVALGTLVQGLEVGGELSVDVPTEIKNQSEIRSKEQHW